MKYNLQNVFDDLSVDESVLTEEHKSNLLNNGYTLFKISEAEWLERGIDIELISNVTNELIEKESWKGGWDHIKHEIKEGHHPEPGAQRLNNLLNKHCCYRKVFTIPEILCAAKFLIKNEFRLSQMILRMPFPGTGEMPWHIDWMPRKKNSEPIRSVLSSLLLDDYYKENGSTSVIPGSHKFLKAPDEDGYIYQEHPDAVYVEAPRGSLLIWDINLWHRGNKNINGKRRRQLNINYRDVNIWQQINFKKNLSKELFDSFTEAELYLLKARDSDPERNDWLFKHRNNFFVKKGLNLLLDLKGA